MRKIWDTDLKHSGDVIIAAILTYRLDEATNRSGTSIDPDHAFIYCRIDGASWSYTYVCRAGRIMYASEADYTGLRAHHPNDPNMIYIYIHIDTRSDQDITYREISKGVTEDQGKSW